jgi:hypothetical protein
MATTTAGITSLDRFHATPTAQRTDEPAPGEQRPVRIRREARAGSPPLPVCAYRWIVGPDGETPASLTIALLRSDRHRTE